MNIKPRLKYNNFSHVNLICINLNKTNFPAGIYLFKVNNENTRAIGEICSKLTIKIKN